MMAKSKEEYCIIVTLHFLLNLFLNTLEKDGNILNLFFLMKDMECLAYICVSMLYLFIISICNI